METIGDAGFIYDGMVGAESLRQVLQTLLSQPEMMEEYRQQAKQRVQTCYTWEAVTDAYERLFYQLCDKPLPERLSSLSAPRGES